MLTLLPAHGVFEFGANARLSVPVERRIFHKEPFTRCIVDTTHLVTLRVHPVSAERLRPRFVSHS